MSEKNGQPRVNVDIAAQPWSGRVDGEGEQHLRWHQHLYAGSEEELAGAVALIGFRSDAGIVRNRGRSGAAEGPAALRTALSQLAIHGHRPLADLGDIVVENDELEAGQERLAAVVDGALAAGALPIVLGGGHETAYGTGSGLLRHLEAEPATRIGILNLDAHFDLREEPQPTSGTPFLDLAKKMQSQDREFRYAVLGISRPSNTAALFATAGELGVSYLLDTQCQLETAQGFVEEFLAQVDVLYLTIDLDVLPASVAPGVSAPAGFGVAYEVIHALCEQVASSGKLSVADVVELNPRFDVDARTARSAARLIHELILA